MDRAQNPNLQILMLAVDQLNELAKDMVFLGGCATGLLITDRAAPPIRVTRDVDAVFGHMPTDETSQARVLMILKTIREIASLKNE